MLKLSVIRKMLLIAALIMNVSFAIAQSDTKVKADNTAVNQRDKSTTQVTADTQAKTAKEDVELTRLIRQELMKDKNLSTYAQNIKIVTVEGVATLRGPVHSLEEKNKVGDHAKKIVGRAQILNELEVVKN